MADVVLCSAIGIASDAVTPPEWLHMLPAGQVGAHDGRGPYRVSDVQTLIAISMAGGKLVLDENHATDLAAPKGLPARASGWIVQLQQRADGIWGRVEWTEQAKRAQVWRSYRGLSPVITHRKDGTVLNILRASLTNTPNLIGLTTLHHMENTVDLRATLIEILGIPAASDDLMIIHKIKALTKQYTGKDVAMMSAQVQPRELALQASVYQGKMAQAGITISHAAAVRAVHDGTMIQTP